jgi:hypothetical protein
MLLCIAAGLVPKVSIASPREDSINVKEEFRPAFQKALESVFGATAQQFAYSDSGNLIFKSNLTGFSHREKRFFRKINKLIRSKTITNVIYASVYRIVYKTGNWGIIKPSISGWEASALIKQDTNLDQNYVVVDTNMPLAISVRLVKPHAYEVDPRLIGASGSNFDTALTVITTNPEISVWHGLGHALYAGHPLNHVIDFDNQARRLYKIQRPDGTFVAASIKDRPYDESHYSMIIWYVR